MIASCGESNTRCSAMVSSTTPRFGPRWPPVRLTLVIRKARISSASLRQLLRSQVTQVVRPLISSSRRHSCESMSELADEHPATQRLLDQGHLSTQPHQPRALLGPGVRRSLDHLGRHVVGEAERTPARPSCAGPHLRLDELGRRTSPAPPGGGAVPGSRDSPTGSSRAGTPRRSAPSPATPADGPGRASPAGRRPAQGLPGDSARRDLPSTPPPDVIEPVFDSSAVGGTVHRAPGAAIGCDAGPPASLVVLFGANLRLLVWLNRRFSGAGSPFGKRSLQLHHQSFATASLHFPHKGKHHGYRYRQVVQR